jgi:hypothetical protein
MRAYVITTGILFALLTGAHLWRIAAESRRLATEPDFVIITLAAAVMTVWAALLLRRRGDSRR